MNSDVVTIADEEDSLLTQSTDSYTKVMRPSVAWLWLLPSHPKHIYRKCRSWNPRQAILQVQTPVLLWGQPLEISAALVSDQY